MTLKANTEYFHVVNQPRLIAPGGGQDSEPLIPGPGLTQVFSATDCDVINPKPEAFQPARGIPFHPGRIGGFALDPFSSFEKYGGQLTGRFST